jgi:hypothetical protein
MRRGKRRVVDGEMNDFESSLMSSSDFLAWAAWWRVRKRMSRVKI